VIATTLGDTAAATSARESPAVPVPAVALTAVATVAGRSSSLVVA
jgi:hypothetical protein